MIDRKLIAAAALLAGCAASDDAKPTWEEFRAAAIRNFDGEQLFVAQGDIGVSESELRELYVEAYDKLGTASQESIVNRINGRDDIWRNGAQLDLTYCVSNEFGSSKARAVEEMAQATAAWESVARVNFNYVSAQDGRCRGSNRRVTFAVRPWSDGGACAFFPSGSACVSRTLVIDIPDLDTNYGDIAPNVRTVGVFRHELGHILGLRHEHTRPETGVCFEDNSWRALSPYDRSSVMHYPWCNGSTGSDLRITASDAAGVRALYGAP